MECVSQNEPPAGAGSILNQVTHRFVISPGTSILTALLSRRNRGGVDGARKFSEFRNMRAFSLVRVIGPSFKRANSVFNRTLLEHSVMTQQKKRGVSHPMKLLARERRGSGAAPPARDILAYDQIIIDALVQGGRAR
jgi:hypothetical protein